MNHILKSFLYWFVHPSRSKNGEQIEFSEIIHQREGDDQAFELHFVHVKKEDFGMVNLSVNNFLGCKNRLIK